MITATINLLPPDEDTTTTVEQTILNHGCTIISSIENGNYGSYDLTFSVANMQILNEIAFDIYCDISDFHIVSS